MAIERDPKSTIALVSTLAATLPQVGEVIRRRRRDEHGQINPYMELHDVTDWLIEKLRSPTLDSNDLREVDVLFQVLSTNFEIGDQDVDDLIAAAVLEHLWLAGPDRVRILERMPPKLAAWARLSGGEHR